MSIIWILSVKIKILLLWSLSNCFDLEWTRVTSRPFFENLTWWASFWYIIFYLTWNLTPHSKFWPPLISNNFSFFDFWGLEMFTLNQAKSWSSAYHQYTHDNKTEFPNEVNILERFNIYQEIFLALIYKTFQNWITLRPILFYAYSVFNLQAMYSFVLYATAWTLTGNWLTAIPTVVYFTFSRFDMTRVEFTVPLRER